MPQTVADVMDLRRLLCLQTSVVTATMWSASSECTKPKPNPVRRITRADKSMDF
jgi:hypothetical protein